MNMFGRFREVLQTGMASVRAGVASFKEEVLDRVITTGDATREANHRGISKSHESLLRSVPDRTIKQGQNEVVTKVVMEDLAKSVQGKSPKQVKWLTNRAKRFIHDHKAPAQHTKGLIEKENPELAQKIAKAVADPKWAEKREVLAKNVGKNIETSKGRRVKKRKKNLRANRPLEKFLVDKGVDVGIDFLANTAKMQLGVPALIVAQTMENLADKNVDTLADAVAKAAVDTVVMKGGRYLKDNAALPAVKWADKQVATSGLAKTDPIVKGISQVLHNTGGGALVKKAAGMIPEGQLKKVVGKVADAVDLKTAVHDNVEGVQKVHKAVVATGAKVVGRAIGNVKKLIKHKEPKSSGVTAKKGSKAKGQNKRLASRQHPIQHAEKSISGPKNGG